MSNKRRGIQTEREAKTLLEQEGYVVVRSAASLGPVDLVAFNQHCVRFVQVKLENKKRYYSEVNGLCNLPCPPNCSVELWVKRGASWQQQVIPTGQEVRA